MTRLTRMAAYAAALAILSILPAKATAGNLDNPGILPPDSHPYGMTYSDWTAAYWQWALAIPAPMNPLADTTGEYADVGQSGPVWFLGTLIGTAAPVTRTFEVPAGKALFFPLASAIDLQLPNEPPFHEQASRAFLASALDPLVDVQCIIDGEPVNNTTAYRFPSPLFFADIPADDVFGLSFGAFKSGPNVSDGFWLMVRPLPPGEHTIEVLVPAFGLDIAYELTVVSGGR